MIVGTIIDNDRFLLLDENENIIKVKELGYVIALRNQREYYIVRMDDMIVEASSNKIDVYIHPSNTSRLEYYSNCNKTVSSRDTIVIFSVRDENKFAILEGIIKKIMIKGKKCLY